MVERPSRGEVYWTALDPVVGAEIGKLRPAVVVQNDVGNLYSPTTIVAAITSRRPKRPYPFMVALPEGALPRSSSVDCSHVRTVDMSRLRDGCLAVLDDDTMRRVDAALRASFGLR